MHLLRPELHSRRAFLKRSAQLAMAGTALPTALNLAAMGEAAAFNAPGGDYKALVCVFMYGGNDYGNFVVPFDNANYDLYHAIRGGGVAGRGASGIALAQSALTELIPSAAPADSMGSTTRKFALHPSMTGLTSLFNAGNAGVVLNVGPLVKPLTRAQYENSDHVAYPRPPQLFSHNDQQSIWQSSSPEGSTIGWGGQMGDLALSSGTNTSASSTFTCMSVTGNAVYLQGDQALQYQVTTNGAIAINAARTNENVYGAGSPNYAVSNALRTIIEQTSTHKFESEYNKVTARARAAEGTISTALALSEPWPITGASTLFPTDGLGRQLRMVARLIQGVKNSAITGVRRQVFLVSIGGFDLHDNLITGHQSTLSSVSAGMSAFYEATRLMGLENQVTSFTASDFGRTLASNGDGSDHGWGSHHLVVGGAVNGTAATKGKFYGTAPPISVADTKDSGGAYLPQNKWHVGQGRLLPSTSVDQYAATLAKWFGVDPVSEMASAVVPKIVNFGGTLDGQSYPVDLGFMS
jgi:uncharacterized protein (DUF1501 family)